MATIFKYNKRDKRTKRLTIMWFVVLAAILFCVWFFWGEGGYVTAWTISLIFAAFLLYLMSIPRKIVVGKAAFEIRCVIEVTHIKYTDLQSVRILDKSEMTHQMVLLGSYGFFGYFGYYLNFEKWELIKLYCSQWDNFVEIVDVYEKRYIVSVADPSAFVDILSAAALQSKE